MEKLLAPKSDRSFPSGWPKDMPLLSLEKSEELARSAEDMIANLLDELKTKTAGPTAEMLHTVINI